ncbi:MAG: hypothetical protein GY789_21620 [Hyphomicrobiales bacterium]|nr:hypothetical protein [Hyphomicrobiales bacterium]
MHRLILIVATIIFTVAPLAAQEEKKYVNIGGDSFRAGKTVVFNSDGVDDLFMAGETVRGERAISGSAHLAGRKVTMAGAVGGDAYLAGMDVSLDGPVSGDATLAGYNVRVGQVGGDLRISGANLVISGPVSGYALIAGDEVQFEAVIAGNVSLAAREVDFGEGARIDGRLTVYEENSGAVEIPAEVVPETRIERRNISEWSEATGDLKLWSWRRAVGRFLIGIFIVAAIAALIAAIVPQRLADLRRGILDHPFRNFWFGFLAQSVLIGSSILLMMTIIGFVLAPAAVVITLISAFAGYVVAVYAFGVGLLLTFGRPEPNSIGTRALAAGAGALVVGVIALIPILGWLFVLALALTGVGSIAIWLLRPTFFATP